MPAPGLGRCNPYCRLRLSRSSSASSQAWVGNRSSCERFLFRRRIWNSPIVSERELQLVRAAHWLDRAAGGLGLWLPASPPIDRSFCTILAIAGCNSFILVLCFSFSLQYLTAAITQTAKRSAVPGSKSQADSAASSIIFLVGRLVADRISQMIASKPTITCSQSTFVRTLWPGPAFETHRKARTISSVLA